ncbi:tRNA (guanosine(46)-N7)-methyltransferase TrmB [Paenibacillus sp. y28]|uniref:tRNA (guanosine(46)-N7)-methyltransferase TrmB n=1 Tax=Paenibacillus sp. y28 TaxID=3129110 RepID=UPI00301A3197
MRLRGRKGILEALESQPELVILQPEQHKGRWHELFGNGKPIYVELGMGKGKFISEMSWLYREEANFIGVDMYDELIRRGAEKARKLWNEQAGTEPQNLRLARFNIEALENVFAPDELERVYLNFSDPWPKSKHARRRLTHYNFVDKYRSVLNERGQIHFKTDSTSLFEFSLNSFSDMGLQMRNITLDLHREGPAENNVMTEYESKFVSRGMPIYRCEVLIGPAALEAHRQQLEAVRKKPVPAAEV